MGDVRVSGIGEARKALRVAGCSPQDVDRFAAAFAAVADGLRSEIVMQIAQTAVVRPGDTLVVRVAARTSPEEASLARESLRAIVPGADVVIVGSDEEMVVYRPEAPRFEVTAGPDVTAEQAARFAKEMERKIGTSVSWTAR